MHIYKIARWEFNLHRLNYGNKIERKLFLSKLFYLILQIQRNLWRDGWMRTKCCLLYHFICHCLRYGVSKSLVVDPLVNKPMCSGEEINQLLIQITNCLLSYLFAAENRMLWQITILSLFNFSVINQQDCFSYASQQFKNFQFI